jgi:serine/threonine protein phosphatase 1
MVLGEAAIPQGLRVYAIGDVHGRADCLTQLLDMIEADRLANPVAASKIVMLGDYTDRGPHSREVVEMLAGRANDGDFICLKGNHDEWFLSFLTDPDEGDGFLNWGGIQTLESYGVDLTGSIRSNAELARELSRLIPPEHRRFLSHLRLFHEEGDYFFCHAGVRPGVALQFRTPTTSCGSGANSTPTRAISQRSLSTGTRRNRRWTSRRTASTSIRGRSTPVC